MTGYLYKKFYTNSTYKFNPIKLYIIILLKIFDYCNNISKNYNALHE